MPRLLELFSGTGSVGKVFQSREWEVVSVDLLHNDDYPPTHQCDIMDFDYTMFDEGYFDVIHASPPCQQYSLARSRAKTPRDLEGSDKLVMQTKKYRMSFTKTVLARKSCHRLIEDSSVYARFERVRIKSVLLYVPNG